MRLASTLVLCICLDESSIDYDKARGLEVADTSEKVTSKAKATEISPLSYTAILSDFYVIVFLLSVMLFHFSNATTMPLLSQHLFKSNAERGYEFATMAVITDQIFMLASACVAG